LIRINFFFFDCICWKWNCKRQILSSLQLSSAADDLLWIRIPFFFMDPDILHDKSKFTCSIIFYIIIGVGADVIRYVVVHIWYGAATSSKFHLTGTSTVDVGRQIWTSNFYKECCGFRSGKIMRIHATLQVSVSRCQRSSCRLLLQHLPRSISHGLSSVQYLYLSV
jgi:hypothetical protein